jgi:hypothetical protein
MHPHVKDSINASGCRTLYIPFRSNHIPGAMLSRGVSRLHAVLGVSEYRSRHCCRRLAGVDRAAGGFEDQREAPIDEIDSRNRRRTIARWRVNDEKAAEPFPARVPSAGQFSDTLRRTRHQCLSTCQ